MRIARTAAVSFAVAVASARALGAQQLDAAQREVWRAVEARWQAWQAGDLEKMLRLYHPRFHAWNRVSGRLDGHDSLLTRWRSALQSESILAVKLEPVVVEVFGDVAAAYYVSRETVKPAPAAPARPSATDSTTVSIRWSDYLVREDGRWLFVGYSGTPCSQAEPPGSVCRGPR
jgi:uncharacterized protein (TIGR02246 family)